MHLSLLVDLPDHLRPGEGDMHRHIDAARYQDGHIGHHPLVTVGRPDPDAIASVDPTCHEAASDYLALLDELRVRGSMILVRDHQRLAVAEMFSRASEVLKDGLAQQRNAAGTVNVAERAQTSHLHPGLPLNCALPTTRRTSRCTHGKN